MGWWADKQNVLASFGVYFNFDPSCVVILNERQNKPAEEMRLTVKRISEKVACQNFLKGFAFSCE